MLDLYRRKLLRSYAPRRFRSMSPSGRRRWVAAHADFADAHVPAQMGTQLDFPFRQRSELVRARDVPALLRLAEAETTLTSRPQATVPVLEESSLVFGLRFEPGAVFDAVRVLAPDRASGAGVVTVHGNLSIDQRGL